MIGQPRQYNRVNTSRTNARTGKQDIRDRTGKKVQDGQNMTAWTGNLQKYNRDSRAVAEQP